MALVLWGTIGGGTIKCVCRRAMAMVALRWSFRSRHDGDDDVCSSLWGVAMKRRDKKGLVGPVPQRQSGNSSLLLAVIPSSEETCLIPEGDLEKAVPLRHAGEVPLSKAEAVPRSLEVEVPERRWDGALGEGGILSR